MIVTEITGDNSDVLLTIVMEPATDTTDIVWGFNGEMYHAEINNSPENNTIDLTISAIISIKKIMKDKFDKLRVWDMPNTQYNVFDVLISDDDHKDNTIKLKFTKEGTASNPLVKDGFIEQYRGEVLLRNNRYCYVFERSKGDDLYCLFKKGLLCGKLKSKVKEKSYPPFKLNTEDVFLEQLDRVHDMNMIDREPGMI